MKNNIHLGQNFLSKFNILQKFINMRRDNFEDKENFYIILFIVFYITCAIFVQIKLLYRIITSCIVNLIL